MKIFALHGFLGLPQDWAFLGPAGEVIAVDYMRIPELRPDQDFSSWGRSFNSWVDQNFAPSEKILVGYSLGGRLALQALEDRPESWSKALLLSVNPGLTTESARVARLQNDQAWAEKFRRFPWLPLMRDWNTQPVFANSVREPHREEKDFDRESLALVLENWSLARQQNFLASKTIHSKPTTWLAGEFDGKFSDILTQVSSAFPHAKTALIPEASHRLLFDSPAAVEATLKGMIK